MSNLTNTKTVILTDANGQMYGQGSPAAEIAVECISFGLFKGGADLSTFTVTVDDVATTEYDERIRYNYAFSQTDEYKSIMAKTVMPDLKEVQRDLSLKYVDISDRGGELIDATAGE